LHRAAAKAHGALVGKHYARTALDWSQNMDANRDAVRIIFEATYGRYAGLWMR